jgi:thymidylate synthase
MFRVFERQTADELWLALASAFGQGGAEQSSRAGATKELLHVALSVQDPRQRFVISRTPPINIAFALAEVLWILGGRNDSAFINYFNSGYSRFCSDGPVYHGAYGDRLRRHLGIDQLERAYDALRANPDTRQVVLQIWDSTIDLPGPTGEPVSKDIPCNIVAMLKIRSGALEWTQIMRSNDLFRGLPYNIIQFTALQEVLAGWLGVRMGSYHQVSDSLHIYEKEVPAVAASRPAEIEDNADSLCLPKADFDSVFAELLSTADRIIDESSTAEQLARAANKAALPQSYRNILFVLCAEGARRRENASMMEEMISTCTNVAYRQLYRRWLSRLQNT